VTRKSHYTILGITRDASREGIRAAFRRLAKECHPDHAGEVGTPAFREIQQAYDVLSDPERRRRYDLEHDSKQPVRPWPAAPLTPHQVVEPLIPDPPSSAPRRPGPFPTFDELWDLLDGFPGPITGRSRRSTGTVDVDAVIPENLARRGGRCTIDIPFREICGHCNGTGIRWPSSCPACGRAGWSLRNRPLSLQLPPGIRHGTVVHLRSEQPGGGELRVRLLVGKGWRAPPVR